MRGRHYLPYSTVANEHFSALDTYILKAISISEN